MSGKVDEMKAGEGGSGTGGVPRQGDYSRTGLGVPSASTSENEPNGGAIPPSRLPPAPLRLPLLTSPLPLLREPLSDVERSLFVRLDMERITRKILRLLLVYFNIRHPRSLSALCPPVHSTTASESCC